MVRKFQHLNHPEPLEDGTFLHSVHEVTIDAEGRRKYNRVADDLTFEKAEAYITEHGEWDK